MRDFEQFSNIVLMAKDKWVATSTSPVFLVQPELPESNKMESSFLLVNGVPRKGVARQSGLVCDTTRDWEKWSQAQVSIVTVGSTEEFLPFYDLLMAKRSPSEMIWRTLWSAFWPFENSPPWKVLSSNCSRKTKTIFQLSENERIFKNIFKKMRKIFKPKLRN